MGTRHRARPLPRDEGSGSGRIAFTRWLPELGEQLFTMDTKGGNVVQLTGHEGHSQNCCPAWSPQGDRICFVSRRDGYGRLYAIQADGSHEEQLTAGDAADDDFPAWSPDGTTIAFGRGNHEGWDRLVLLDLSAHKEWQLTSGDLFDQCPCWSPHGGWIAFRRSLGARPGVYAMPVTGGDAHFVTQGHWPSWSPLGDRLAYAHLDSLWAVPVTGAGEPRAPPERLTSEAGVRDRYPSWSPDGRALVFEREHPAPNGRERHIMTVHADGTHLRDLGEGRLPAWSP